MTTQEQWNERRHLATPRGVGLTTQIFAARAQNAEVWDLDGRRYIDFAAGIAVLNTGHLHPKVKAAVAEQLNAFSHTCYQVMPYTGYVELAEKLNARAPISGVKKTMFVTTGAEAVENAVKIARAATDRSAVIAFAGGFHGRTMMGMALTGKVKPYKAGFGPFPGEIFHAPYPNALYGVSVDDAIAGIEHLFKSDVDPLRVAAIILEPVQGEGGFTVCPPEFMQRLRVLADTYGILLIADEIQTGFARTGKLFAMEHYDAEPDLITMAKSLAGGFPLAGVVGRAEVMDAAAPGGLGGTYGGSPIGIAAALAVLDVIDEEKLCERADAIGAKIRATVESVRKDVPSIAEVRGLGAMVAAEFFDNGQPSAEIANAVKARALDAGLILLTCGSYGNVIRFLCPLTIEDDVLDEALAILNTALRG
ncbi:4-aminobutyrate--2-oxoglutarate transaminase [Crenobacter cavernae]|uniref:4-aminobutyrate--2-oxoglutarate transaminase n=1 Tax=Crenobacter cavernae TaxID=2290923 RepID=A0A345Y5N9_9NEIS|nr:4-aminobutyrate--2-oxoglutarate transaminase [Crenobacter cavernae]AXK39241.1 4-aminobutyrate--2-oxoglutarate transaminase [Crenobacter cavernae]